MSNFSMKGSSKFSIGKKCYNITGLNLIKVNIPGIECITEYDAVNMKDTQKEAISYFLLVFIPFFITLYFRSKLLCKITYKTKNYESSYTLRSFTNNFDDFIEKTKSELKERKITKSPEVHIYSRGMFSKRKELNSYKLFK